jgi:hypothetical protein
LAAFILPLFALSLLQSLAYILELSGVGGFFGLRRTEEIFRCTFVCGHIAILDDGRDSRAAVAPERALFLLVAARGAACHLDLRAGCGGRCSGGRAVFLRFSDFAVAADLAFRHGFLLVWDAGQIRYCDLPPAGGAVAAASKG